MWRQNLVILRQKLRRSEPACVPTVLYMSRADLIALMTGTAAVLLCCLGWTTSDHAKRGACANNMRQLGAALIEFSDENDGQFPARRSSPNAWPDKLRGYYADAIVLRCSADVLAVTS